MKARPAEKISDDSSQGNASTKLTRTKRPAGVRDDRTSASVQFQRQPQPDRRHHFMQLKHRQDNLNRDQTMSERLEQVAQAKTSGRPVVQRYSESATHRITDDGNYATEKSNPFNLYVKKGAALPVPLSFFVNTASGVTWDTYVPKARLHPLPPYQDYDGPNDCGMYATGLAKNNPQWGRIQQSYGKLVGKESGRAPHQDNRSVHYNLSGGKTDREIVPDTGEVLLIHPPEGSVSGSGGTSLFAARCNFHASPVVIKSGSDYITNEADAGDPWRAFPHWEMYGSSKEQTFHYKNAIKYKDRFGSNPTNSEWPKTYALKAPQRFIAPVKCLTRNDGTEVFLVIDTNYDALTHIAFRNNNFVAILGSAVPPRYEIIFTSVTYPNGNRVCYVHDGQTNTKTYLEYTAANLFVADRGPGWVRPPQYQLQTKKWTFNNGNEIWMCHDLYHNLNVHITINPVNQQVIETLASPWVQPRIRYEYINLELSYANGEKVWYSHDGLTNTKVYIRVSVTNLLLENLGQAWHRPSQYELMKLIHFSKDGTEVHLAQDRYADRKTYVRIDPIRQRFVEDLGINWRY